MQDGITIYKLSGPRQKIWRGDVSLMNKVGSPHVTHQGLHV